MNSVTVNGVTIHVGDKVYPPRRLVDYHPLTCELSNNVRRIAEQGEKSVVQDINPEGDQLTLVVGGHAVVVSAAAVAEEVQNPSAYILEDSELYLAEPQEEGPAAVPDLAEKSPEGE